MGQLILDGKDFSSHTCGITLESKIGKMPMMTVTFIPSEIEVELEVDGVTVEKALLP